MATVDDETDLEELVSGWVRAREAGEHPDLEDYARRAGAGREELLRRVRVYESLAGLGDDAVAPPVPATPARAAPLEAHASLGRYEILEQIDAGGLARVYLARDPDTDRRVALKVIEEAALVSDQAREWSLVEARSLGRLDHPGIVRVLDVDRADGKDFIVMEHVPGPTLADVLRELERRQSGLPAAGGADGEEDEAEAARRRQVEAAADRLETYTARAELVARVARALAWCHDRGVLHRDVKPANILLPAEGWPRLIDFGLAHIEQQETTVGITTRLVGTAPYVAPEQVDAEQTGSDPASDQYSLGVVLYELLTLLCPFQRNTRALTLDAISRGNPRPPRRVVAAVPRDLERICLHALERDPARRYPSVEDLARDLEAWLEHRPISVSAPSPARALGLWVRRNRTAVLVGAAVVLLSAGAAAFTWHRGNRERLELVDADLAAVDVAALVQPGDFCDAYSRLNHARGTARVFDDAFARRAVYGRQEPPVVGLLDRVSLRLKERLDRLKQDRDGWQIGQDLRIWQQALTLEAEAYPEGEHNRDDQLRGTVRLPAGWSPDEVTLELVAADPSESFFVTEQRPWSDRLTNGAYRIRGPLDPEAGRRLEAGFRIDTGMEPARTLDLVPPRPGLLARLVAVDGAALTLLAGNEPVEVEVPGFLILPGPVTWADLAPFLEQRPDFLDPRDYEALPPDGPARLTWEEASEFALWAGMRLPGTLELHRGLQTGRIERAASREEHARERGLEVVAEWTDDGTWSGESTADRQALDYRAYEQGPPSVPRTWGDSLSAYAVVREGNRTDHSECEEGRIREHHKVAFRLALTR